CTAPSPAIRARRPPRPRPRTEAGPQPAAAVGTQPDGRISGCAPVGWAAMSLFKRVLNAGEGRKLKLLQSIVPEISALEPDMERLSDDELRAQTSEFRR